MVSEVAALPFFVAAARRVRAGANPG